MRLPSKILVSAAAVGLAAIGTLAIQRSIVDELKHHPLVDKLTYVEPHRPTNDTDPAYPYTLRTVNGPAFARPMPDCGDITDDADLPCVTEDDGTNSRYVVESYSPFNTVPLWECTTNDGPLLPCAYPDPTTNEATGVMTWVTLLGAK